MKNVKEIRRSLLIVGILLTVLFFAAFLPSIAQGSRSAQALSASTEAYDLDGNGVVNIADVTRILYILTETGSDASCDLNGDGAVDIEDVTALLNYLESAQTYAGIYSKKEGTAFRSPVSSAVYGSKLYVGDATNNAIYRFTLTGTLERTIYTPYNVSKVHAYGGKIYVLCGERLGRLLVYSSDLRLQKSVDVGHTPTDICVKGTTAYICNRFSNTVSVVDLNAGEETMQIPVSREPVCMALSGNYLYVGSRLQDGSALADRVSSKVVKIDTATNTVVKEIPLQNGVTNLRSMAVSSDGNEIYITHTVARYSYPTTQLDRGWVNTNGFTLLTTSDDVPAAFLLDDVDHGAANPWDVCVSSDGGSLYFSISGTGELVKLDLASAKNRISTVRSGRDSYVDSVFECIHRIDFLAAYKTRMSLPGEGLRDLTLYSGKIYAAGYFSGTVDVVNAADMTLENSFAVGSQPAATAARTGEALWCDARYCYQNWESCSSCHPDARSDGLNWDEGGDGWGTPKNTKSMIFSMRTPPVLATGLMETAEANVMGTVREAFHSNLSKDSVECMNEYLRSLLPVESPYLTDEGVYSEEAQRGKALFESKGCAYCHPAPLYTDLKFHTSPYLGTDGSPENREFITPTLVEIWRSAPYTYCGAVTDLKEIIRTFAREELTNDEVSDLEQFLLSIGTVEEYYGVVETFSQKDGETVYCALTPGSTVKNVSIVKQIPSESEVPAANLRIKLCAPDGRTITSKTVSAGDMTYAVLKTVAVDIDVPANLAVGSYLEIELTSGIKRLASPYRLTYNG